jgi:hypothetical protein
VDEKKSWSLKMGIRAVVLFFLSSEAAASKINFLFTSYLTYPGHATLRRLTAVLLAPVSVKRDENGDPSPPSINL